MTNAADTSDVAFIWVLIRRCIVLAKSAWHIGPGNCTGRALTRLRAVSYVFFANLLHAKPKNASGEAAGREKRGRKPEKKKEKIRDYCLFSFVWGQQTCQGNLIN